MSSSSKRRNIGVVVIILVGVGAFFLYAQKQGSVLREQLATIAQEKLREHEAMTSDTDIEYTATVDFAREYGLIGPAAGTIHVYAKQSGEAGEPTFYGVDYHYNANPRLLAFGK